jgi:hypothetical protein
MRFTAAVKEEKDGGLQKHTHPVVWDEERARVRKRDKVRATLWMPRRRLGWAHLNFDVHTGSTTVQLCNPM